MPQTERAVLRNCHGEHMVELPAEEVEYYSLLAEQGEVDRFIQMKKGKRTLIFKLKVPPAENSDPSQSKNSSCSLTRSDMDGLASMQFSEERISRFQIERWIGYGLIPALPGV